MEVGFIGLGNMGQAMARNLLKAGHSVSVYNRTRSRAEELQPEGARIADTIAAACQAEVVITMLADDAAVEAVVLGQNGVLAALAPGRIHASMSTISVALSERLAAAHAAAGQSYVAAPVFGRPEAALAAKIFVIAAGDSAAIETCRPLFEALGQKTFTIGESPPAANVVKLSGNFLIASVMESLAEVFALVRKHGIPPERVLDVLTGTLFSAPIYQNYGRAIVEQRYEPAGFKLALGLKDMRLALAAAESAMTPMPVASLIRDHFLAAIARGYGDQDWAAVARIAAENAGL